MASDLEDGCQNHFVGIDFEAVNGVNGKRNLGMGII